MSKVKYQLHFYSMYDHTGICRNLENMAAQGWMLEKTGTFCWKYRKCEPQKVHFAINYFPKASEFASGPTEEQKIMFEYCERAGWKHISTVAQMQIFCNEQENPIPLETDAATQVEIISKAMKSSFLPAQILLFLIGVLQLGMALSRFVNHPISALSESMNLFTGLCWIGVILLTGTEFVNYFTWLRKARKAAEEEGRFVKTKSFPKLQIAALVIVFGGMIFSGLASANVAGITSVVFTLIFVPVLFGGVNLMKRFLKRRKVSTGVTRTVTIITSFVLSFSMVFIGVRVVMNVVRDIMEKQSGVETYEYRGMTWESYQDELPLVIEDFMDVGYDEYSYKFEVNETFLAAEYEATQRPRMDALEHPDLYYRIVKVKAPIFYEMCKTEMLEEVERWRNASGYVEAEYRDQYRTVDAKIWQADAAYREHRGDEPQNRFLICWGNKLVEIAFDTFEEGITEEIVSVVVEKLKDF